MDEGSRDPKPGDLTSSGTLDLATAVGAAPAPDVAPTAARRHAPPVAGDLLGGRFEVLSQLGAGGMGVVFRARDRVLDEDVALKTVRLDLPDRAEVVRRFRAEIRLARRIRHVNVAGMYDLLEADGLAFVTMEYVEGSDLKTRMAAGSFPFDERLAVVRQVCLGLGAAHERGIVHRDLKPANVMVAPDGRAVILDFGIARSFRGGDATAGLVLGTPQYMSPEQARGEPAGPASDIYALGVLMYELFTGRLPFRADTPLELVLKHLGEEPEAPSRFGTLPPGLEALILRAMSKDPARRYQGAAELLDALSRIGDEAGATVRTAPGARVASLSERKRLCLLSLQASGFERLAGEMELLEIRHLQRDVLSSLESAAVRFGGTIVEREAAGLLAVFSLPAVRETDPGRALAAARAGVSGIGRLDAAIRGQVVLRAGIHAGHVLVSLAADGKPELLGEDLDLARAVAAQAPAGRVAVSAAFAALLPRSSGLAGSVVARVRAADSRVDVLVDAGEGEAASALERFEEPMIGRTAELETARAILRRVASGPGELLGIVGDAGIGKSRLVFEIAEAARRMGFSVLGCSCRTLEEQAILQPVAQLVRAALDLPEELPSGGELDDLLAERLRALGEPLAALAPACAALLGVAHPRISAMTDAGRRAAFREAVLGLLAARAGRTALLVVVEDAHWLDGASADVLGAVAAGSPGLRLLLCAAYRPEWAPPWGGDEAFTRLVVRPLSEGEVAQLAAGRAGARELSPEVLGLLKDRAEGNPFFVEELLGTLGDRGVLSVTEGRAVLTGEAGTAGLPARIEEVILARIDRLEEQAKEALRSAAVIGRVFPVRLLDRLLGHGAEARELPQLSGAGMVYRKEVLPELQYLFRHVVIRDVAYASLLEKRRKELHGRLAAVIEELYADRLDEWWEVLGRHHEEAGAFEKAKRCYGQAAARARERVTDDVSDALAGKEERMAEALVEAKVEARLPVRKIVGLGFGPVVSILVVFLAIFHLGGWPGGLPEMIRSPKGATLLLRVAAGLLGGGVFLAGCAALGYWIDSLYVRRQRLAFVVHSSWLGVSTRRGPLQVPFGAIREVFSGTLRTLMPTALGMAICDYGQVKVSGLAVFLRWPRPRRVFSFGGVFGKGKALFVRKERSRPGTFLERNHWVVELAILAFLVAWVAVAVARLRSSWSMDLGGSLARTALVPLGIAVLLDACNKRWLSRHLSGILDSAELVAIHTPNVDELEAALTVALEKFQREEAAREAAREKPEPSEPTP